MTHLIRWIALLTVSGPAYAVELPARGDSPATVKAICPDAAGLDDLQLLSRTCGQKASIAWLGDAAPEDAVMYLTIEQGVVASIRIVARFQPLPGFLARAHALKTLCPEGTLDKMYRSECEVTGEARQIWLTRNRTGASVAVSRSLPWDERDHGPPQVPGLDIYLGDPLAVVQAGCPGKREADRWLPNDACREAILKRRIFLLQLPARTEVSLRLEGDTLVGWRMAGKIQSHSAELLQLYFERTFCSDGCDRPPYGHITGSVDLVTSTFDFQATLAPPDSEAQ